jgi:glycerol-3-phosphate dehydrogenase (NAD(P)+)
MAEPRVAVVGAGSWGTAFASTLAEKGVATELWARRPELARAISETHRNPDYLPDVDLPAGLTATHELDAAVEPATVVAMAVPSHAYREIYRRVAAVRGVAAPVVSLSKGLEQGTLMRMTEVMRHEGLPAHLAAVLSGPNLSREIVAHHPSATVVACGDEDEAARLQALFMAPHFRVYRGNDVIGVELGGAMKNVLAIAAGMVDGMGFGDNAKAALITRGLAELARLGTRLGGNPFTFSGLAGMGDLIATCMSPLSRNRRVGEELGKGRTLDDVVAQTNTVAEGVKTSLALSALADRTGVEAPIVDAVVQVLYGGVACRDVLVSLMVREAKPEIYGMSVPGEGVQG